MRRKILSPKAQCRDISLKFTCLVIRETLYSGSVQYAGKSQSRDFVFEKTDVKNKPNGSYQPTMQQT